MRRFYGITVMAAALGAPAEAAAPAVTPATCRAEHRAYSEKVGANADHSSADEWDRIGRTCLEVGAWTDGIRAYRTGLAHHKELRDRLANLGVVYADSSRWELAYCLVPKNKEYKKNWEKTKRTARLCEETDKKGFLFVPADLRDR